MATSHLFVFDGEIFQVGVGRLRHEILCHADRATRIRHINHRAVVMRCNLDGRMDPTCRGTANHQRNFSTAKILVALHLTGHIGHFFEARRNQSGQTNNIDLFSFRTGQNLRGRHHHAHVDDFKVVTLQHDRDNIFSNIVHITFDRRNQDFAFGPDITTRGLDQLFFLFDKGYKMPHRLLHHTGRFDDLGQKHFALAKQITDDIHTIHQRPFNHLDRASATIRDLLTDFLCVFDNELRHTTHHCVRQTLFNRLLAPGEVLFALGSAALDRVRKRHQPFGWRAGVIRFRQTDRLRTVEHHIFD